MILPARLTAGHVVQSTGRARKHALILRNKEVVSENIYNNLLTLIVVSLNGEAVESSWVKWIDHRVECDCYLVLVGRGKYS